MPAFPVSTPPPIGPAGATIGDGLMLHRRLEELVASAPPGGQRPALLLFELEGFSTIEELHGRAVVQHVLEAITSRLMSVVARHGTFYQASDDYFAVLLESTDPDQTNATAQALVASLGEQIDAAGTEIQFPVSVGAVMLGDRRRAGGVLRDAEVTLYRAKAAGAAGICLYDWEVDEWACALIRDGVRLAAELEEARRENDLLKGAVLVDPLTGLPNKAAFDADHRQLFAGRSRSGRIYSVLFAEIDPAYDRQAGGRLAAPQPAVQALGRCIEETVRQGDRAYRYDDSKFAVLYPATNLEQAVIAAERIRARLHEEAIDHPDRPLGVLSLTIGVVEGGFRHETPADVVAEVDARVAEGHEAGGDKVAWR